MYFLHTSSAHTYQACRAFMSSGDARSINATLTLSISRIPATRTDTSRILFATKIKAFLLVFGHNIASYERFEHQTMNV